MPGNPSSSNDSLLHAPSIKFSVPAAMYCFISRPGFLIYTTFYVIHMLLLVPLCISVLYLGLRRWGRQGSTSTAPATGHSDSYTYHTVAIELFGIVGYTLCCFGVCEARVGVVFAGYSIWSFTWYGETLLYLLTCVERYLAVAHPISYRSLRGDRGTRIRDISTGCVWLFSVVGASLLFLEQTSATLDFCLLICSLVVITFCSLSVLCALIRPGPGEQGGDRDRVDRSKQRAFYTMVAILGVLLLRLFWNLLWVGISSVTGKSECVSMVSGVWSNLPASLVSPLLFLHRAGTLACCEKKDTP